jgi:hypothetical protein
MKRGEEPVRETVAGLRDPKSAGYLIQLPVAQFVSPVVIYNIIAHKTPLCLKAQVSSGVLFA